MLRVVCMILLLQACAGAGEPPAGSREAAADSLIRFIKTGVRPLLQSRQTDAAKNILDSLHPIVIEMDQYKLTCTWLTFKSSLGVLNGQLDSARYYIDQAMTIASKEDTTKRILLEVQIQYANTLNEQKSLDSALLYAREAYDLAKKSDTTLIPVICYRLYEMYRIIDDHAAMKKYLFEGFTRSDQPLFRIAFANGIADYYERVHQLDSAIAFFRTVETDTSFSDPYFMAVKYNNLGTFLSKKGAYREALPYQLKAMTINKDMGQLSGWAFYSLSETYYELKDDVNAAIFLDSALQLAKQQQDWTLVTKLWKERSKRYEASQQYQNAYRMLDSAFAYYHIEVDSSIAVQAKELEAKYAGKAKDEAIQTLSFRNETNQRMADQRRLIIIALSIAFMSLMAVGILLWRRRQLQVNMREASLRQQLLRSQINPHFLFNNLAVLQSTIRKVETEKSLQYLNSFARLLRISLENAQHSYVSLKSEIEALENYLRLQSIYLDSKFDYNVQVDQSLLQDAIRIPPMLIQPFVENAVIHGVSKVDYKGVITIKMEKKEHLLHCVIDDNGRGLQEKYHNHYRKSSSTQMIRDRLAILSRQTRQPATLTILDKQAINEGTGVKVIINIGLDGTAIGQL